MEVCGGTRCLTRLEMERGEARWSLEMWPAAEQEAVALKLVEPEREWASLKIQELWLVLVLSAVPETRQS